MLFSKKQTILFLFSLLLFSLSAQYKTQILQDHIKSLQVNRSDWNLSYPVIYLDRPLDGITINFDMLEAEMHQITYTIIHCDAEWERSDLSVNEYLEGFQESFIENYDYSRSTNIDYVNYQLRIPNDDVQLTKSGNYTVVVYDQDNEDTLLTACFYIVEPLVTIYGAVGGIAHSGRSNAKQQLNFSIIHPNYPFGQPLVETKVVAFQNNSRHHQVISSTPTYIREGKLIYEQNPKFTFLGGGEYRTFEASSIRFKGQGIQDITFFSPYYHFTLRPSDIRYHKAYEFDNDINGKFVIRRQESADEDIDTEADYLLVHFSLPMEDPILDGKVYVGGGFTYDALDETNQMIYNTKTKAYEGHFLLKQGYYNYRYYVLSNWDGELKSAPIEMDAFQTENDYQIFFYHHPIGERYDRLIGYQVINTLGK